MSIILDGENFTIAEDQGLCNLLAALGVRAGFCLVQPFSYSNRLIPAIKLTDHDLIIAIPSIFESTPKFKVWTEDLLSIDSFASYSLSELLGYVDAIAYAAHID